MLPLLMLALAAEPAPPSRLAVIREVPDFSLTATDGSVVTQADLRGRVTLVSFVFTTCTGSCPQTTLRLAKVQEKLTAARFGPDDVRLLSVTLDPERDSPEVLTRYAKRHDTDPARWRFLTGKPEAVAATLTAWEMWAKPGKDGQLDHPSRVFLVDRRGRIREVYSLEFLRPDWVVDDVDELLRETER